MFIAPGSGHAAGRGDRITGSGGTALAGRRSEGHRPPGRADLGRGAGPPAEALALAANDLGCRGLVIEPGWIVLTGGMTDAIPVPPGVTLAAHFTPIGLVFLPGG
jgi:hypothetical protein